MNDLLILGARGMLGRQLHALCPDAAAWDLEDVDVLNPSALAARIAALAPAAIVNCVAFNDVDGAEDRPEEAFALNAAYPGRLARLAAAGDIPLVHYSTNYVFDGTRGRYTETDPTSPLSVYGTSKRDGEEAVLAAGGRAWVVRTSVIFGPRGTSALSKRSFVDLMLDLAAQRDTIQAVEDEVNSVTYAPDLAQATLRLLADSPAPGICHLANPGEASWCDFAREVFRAAGKEVKVIPVPSSRFPRKARRPARAVLINTLRPALRPWRDALAELLARPDRLS